MAKLMTEPEGRTFIKRWGPNLATYNAILFSQDIPKGEIPGISFEWEDDSYFRSDQNRIVIGVKGMIPRFSIGSEEQAWSCSKYLHGHESQHRLSTTARSYSWGIYGGLQKICEYICRQHKISFRFRKMDDYRYFVENILPSSGIYLDWRGVQTMVAGICNSLEDGRIERIRSNRMEGFDRLRRYYRGVDWMNADYDYIEYGKLNAIQKLYITFNQILFLATCQVYQKGFSSFYAGTPFISEVGALMPYIAKAVMAGTCREMSENAIKVIEMLAPNILDAYSLSEKDILAKKILEELLREIAKRFTHDPSSNIDENQEDIDGGSINSVFENCDLEIELDKETYEKLKDGTNRESGIKVKVKVKDPEENEKGKRDAQESSAPSDGSTSDKNADGAGDKKRKGEDLTDTGKNRGDRPPGTSAGDDEGSDKNGSSSHPKESTEGSSNERSGGLTNDQTDYTEQIEEEMRKAAEQNDAEAHEAAERKTAGDVSTTAFYKKEEIRDISDPLPEDFAEGMCRFKEVHRAYKVELPLPEEILREGRSLYNRNKRYFKSLSSPNVSFQDSGTVDPGRIAELAFGSTDIFLKKGIDMAFDGCAYILVDNSGSMSGKKRTAACIAAAKIEEAFRGLIPIKIAAFDVYGKVIHEVIKNWDESLRFNCCWNFCQRGRMGDGNEDGYDIMIATKELLARPEQHRLLIVLSDGAPGNRSLVRRAVEDARKKGIQVNGIYFEENLVRRTDPAMEYMYQKDYVICPETEISENLDRIFKKWSRSH